MRTLSPHAKFLAVFALILGFALLFGGCVQPVNIQAFLKDPDVVASVGGGGWLKIKFENPGNYSPVVGPVGTVDNPVTIGATKPTPTPTATITVTNALNADGNNTPYDTIEWFYYDGVSFTAFTAMTGLSSVGGATTLNQLTADVANAPFDTPGLYQISVVGTLDSKPYHREFYIKVE